MCILHGSFSFPLCALRKGHKVKFMQLTVFHNCLQSWNKTSFLRPKDGLKTCPFPVLTLPLIHIFVTHLCYNFALVSGNGCEIKVNKLETPGRSSWIKPLTLEMEVAWGTQSLVDCSPSTVCNLLMARDLWVLWTSLRSSTTPMASHRGIIWA